jgi:hypothetical protein
MATLCDYFQKNQTCWGKIVTHKRLGKDGRDKGKVVEVVATCEGHEESGKCDRRGLYKTPADLENPGYWSKDELYY